MNFLQLILVALFCACAAGVAYAYAVYPLLIWAVSRAFGRTRVPPAGESPDGESPDGESPDGESPDGGLPSVSLLIAAHNEEAVIEDRVRNALALNYPGTKLEVVVASDGSTDRTSEVVRRYAARGVRLLDYAERRGKATVINSAFAELTGDVVVLSDANTFTDPDAVRSLARWFADPAIGVVCGRLVLTDPATGRNADGLYWKYETFLKKCEARLGALLGSNGAIYAIRRDLYSPIPSSTIVDDFVIPLAAKQRSGCDIVYDANAVAREESAPDVAAEFGRRSRIGAGGFQAIGLLWRLLSPRHGWLAFSFLSHKVLRWVCPFLLIGALATNILLALTDRPAFLLALGAQLALYALSLAGTWVPPGLKVSKPLRLAALFAGMNAALFVGFCRWARGGQNGTWRRTARPSDSSG